MNKDKHVIPDTDDTLSARIKRDAKKNRRNKTIYGPDNEPLEDVDVEFGRESTPTKKRR